MKIVLLAAAAALVAGISAPASAYVIGDSNLGPLGYPDFARVHFVYEPQQPYDASNSYDNERYRNQVKEYVEKTKEYVEAANNDIRRIREAEEEAISKANEAVDRYNRWVRMNSN